MAEGESILRSMIASGIGAGIPATRTRHSRRSATASSGFGTDGGAHSWLCWIEPAQAKRSEAVEAVRTAVLEAWA